MAKPNKQIVFLVAAGPEGSGQKDAACAVKGGLTGKVVSIQYITDGARTYDKTANFVFTGALTATPIFSAENVSERMTWNLENGPDLDGEPVRCVVTGAGAGNVGSFVVTCK